MGPPSCWSPLYKRGYTQFPTTNGVFIGLNIFRVPSQGVFPHHFPRAAPPQLNLYNLSATWLGEPSPNKKISHMGPETGKWKTHLLLEFWTIFFWTKILK